MNVETSLLPALPYRCGHVCARAAGTATCRCPNSMGNPQVVPIEDARKRGGPCGPEALHLKFKG